MKKGRSKAKRKANLDDVEGVDDGDEGGAALFPGKAPQRQQKRHVVAEEPKNVIAQFVSAEGAKTGAPLDIPVSFTENELQEVLNELLSNEDPLPYSFFVKDEELVRDLKTFLETRSISTG